MKKQIQKKKIQSINWKWVHEKYLENFRTTIVVQKLRVRFGWQNYPLQRDPWSILRQWSKFHLVIIFHCRVTVIFVKVIFVMTWKFKISKMDVKNEWRRVIKFCCRLKKCAVETVKLMHEAYTDEEQGTYRWKMPTKCYLCLVSQWNTYAI